MEIYKNWFMVLIVVFTGCKKGEVAAETTGKVVPPVVEPGVKVLVPVELGTGKSKMVISYTEGMAFSKIEYGDGKSTVITYSKLGKPLDLLRYKQNELISATIYSLDEKGRVIQGKTAVMDDGNYVLTGHYDLRYNELDQVIGVDYTDLYGHQQVKQERWYSERGNLSSEKNGTTSITYSYDLKNGLFKHVRYAWLLTIEKENSLFLSGINNVLSCTNPLKPGNDQSFSYAYNGDNYPEVINTIINGVKSSAKVIYKEISAK